MGSVTARRLGRALRAGTVDPAGWSDERVATVWEHFDQGTQRAVLRVVRSIDPAGLAQAGAQLSGLEIPTLVVWGERDPWLSPDFGRAYAERLPAAELELVANAGHWPWLDSPGVVDRVSRFLATA